MPRLIWVCTYKVSLKGSSTLVQGVASSGEWMTGRSIWRTWPIQGVRVSMGNKGEPIVFLESHCMVPLWSNKSHRELMPNHCCGLSGWATSRRNVPAKSGLDNPENW